MKARDFFDVAFDYRGDRYRVEALRIHTGRKQTRQNPADPPEVEQWVHVSRDGVFLVEGQAAELFAEPEFEAEAIQAAFSLDI